MFNRHIHRKVGPVFLRQHLNSSNPNSFHGILDSIFFSQVKMDKSPQRNSTPSAKVAPENGNQISTLDVLQNE